MYLLNKIPKILLHIFHKYVFRPILWNLSWSATSDCSFFFKPVSQTRSSTWRTVEKAPINIPRIQVYWAGNHKKRWIVILADCITRLARPLSPSSCSVSSPAQTWRAAVPLPLQSELAARVECEAGMWGYLSWSGESRQHNVSVYAQDTSESGMSFAQVFPRQAAGLQEVLVIL